VEPSSKRPRRPAWLCRSDVYEEEPLRTPRIRFSTCRTDLRRTGYVTHGDANSVHRHLRQITAYAAGKPINVVNLTPSSRQCRSPAGGRAETLLALADVTGVGGVPQMSRAVPHSASAGGRGATARIE
jgi:hypothetical protein